MKTILNILLCVSIFLSGCAGADPNPVAIYLAGDENKSCASLKAEIANIDKQIALKKSQKSSQESTNVILGITGFFVLVPWFFMDLKENEKAEIDALQQRKDALLVIAAEKNCDMGGIGINTTEDFEEQKPELGKKPTKKLVF